MLKKEKAKKTLYTLYTLLPASKENATHEGNGKKYIFKNHSYVH